MLTDEGPGPQTSVPRAWDLATRASNYVCVVVPAGCPGGVAVVTAFGGRPGAVSGTFVFGASGDGDTGFVVFPSAPFDGSGAAPGMP